MQKNQVPSSVFTIEIRQVKDKRELKKKFCCRMTISTLDTLNLINNSLIKVTFTLLNSYFYLYLIWIYIILSPSVLSNLRRKKRNVR